MKKLVASVSALAFMVSQAFACQINCGPVVPDVTYGGGGVEVQTVKATACFDIENRYGERYILDAIGDNGKPFPYTADFVYKPKTGSHEVIKTVSNGSSCWTHEVPVGTWMAVYVTCKTYTGWVAVKVTAPGTYTMTKVPWMFVENL